MYGGLFGDLPSAKKQKKTPPTTSTNDDGNEKKGANESSSSSSTGEKGGATTKTIREPAKANWFAPRQAAAKPKASSNNKSQFLQMVGKSGTTMAFVPTAALKSTRKKTAVAASTSNNTKSTNTVPEKDGETNKKILSNANITDQQSSFAATTTTTTTTRVAVSNSEKDMPAAVVDIHGMGNSLVAKMDSNIVAMVGDASSLPKTVTETTTEEDKITDPYDPYVPNDLLEYWETLAAKKHREKLERDTLEALEKQRVLRQQLEDDRKALLQTARVGDAPPRSMGRGRGVSNLPAWLVEKRRTSESGVVGNNERTPSFRGRGRGVSNLPAWLVEKQRKEASEGQ